MTRRRLLLAIMVLNASVAAPSPAAGPGHALVVMPLFSRVIGFHLPLDMIAQEPQANGREFLMEFVPRGETVENWTRLVTVRAILLAGRQQLASGDIARALFNPKTCTQAHLYRDFGEHAIDASLRRSVIAMGCGSLPAGAYPAAIERAGEQDFIYLFRDAGAVYSLNYAVRGSAFVNSPPIDPAQAETIMRKQFGDVMVCATAADAGCSEIIAANTARRAGK